MNVEQTIENYIKKQSHFKSELEYLRKLILSTELEETIKWRMPTYCIDNKNILGLGGFKNHFCIWFHHGALINDEHNLLINAQKGKTKAMRQMRFESMEDIDENLVIKYVRNAIENHLKGKSIKIDKNRPIHIPDIIEKKLKANHDLKIAFENLTPGRQREYCEYISTAKRESTQNSRLSKIIPMILNGKGLNDKYKS